MIFLGNILNHSFLENGISKINYLTHMCPSHQGTMVVSNQSHTTLK
jgi:hypothetical protein